LGAEQSGFITDIGFETYHRILDEALVELKEKEFQYLYMTPEVSTELPETRKYVKDCYIDTDFELLFPDEYINNISERLRLYRVLDNIDSEQKLKSFESQLEDRFGPLPRQTFELLQVVRLRWIAMDSGFEKIIMKKNKMILYFLSDQQSGYFSSPIFQKIIAYIQTQPERFKLKESNNKLTLTTEPVESIADAIRIMEGIRLNSQSELVT